MKIKKGYLIRTMLGITMALSLPMAKAAENPQMPVSPSNAQSPTNTEAPGTKAMDSVPNKNNETLNITPTSPQAALQRLLDGNKRFMKDQTICPERTEERRLATIEKQKPFAVIVGCSDSRIPPEFAFDQGIGDIFVVRIAGNVVSKLEMDSIEYSILHNGSIIIVVLGHQNCGAVQAVMANDTKDIESIAELIKPALYKPNHEKLSLEEAIITNVKNSVARIKRSRVISEMIKKGKIDVVGSYYDFATGEVRIVQ